jgi:hypothetical protein
MDLQIPRSSGASGRGAESFDIMDGGSGIIQPPPLDPLDGLEVIVGGTFTVGRLRMVASRRLRAGLNMFVDEDPSYISNRDDDDDDDYDSDDGFLDVTRLPMTDGGKALIEADFAAQREAEELVEDDEQEDNDDKDEAEYTKAMEEAAKAEEEAATAASEAKRKVEKMEMLRKRAEEALAKRKQKKAEQ